MVLDERVEQCSLSYKARFRLQAFLFNFDLAILASI